MVFSGFKNYGVLGIWGSEDYGVLRIWGIGCFEDLRIWCSENLRNRFRRFEDMVFLRMI